MVRVYNLRKELALQQDFKEWHATAFMLKLRRCARVNTGHFWGWGYLAVLYGSYEFVWIMYPKIEGYMYLKWIREQHKCV